jgi:hypothetical protein
MADQKAKMGGEEILNHLKMPIRRFQKSECQVPP